MANSKCEKCGVNLLVSEVNLLPVGVSEKYELTNHQILCRRCYDEELEIRGISAIDTIEVISSDGKELGLGHEGEDLYCEMEGCNGTQIVVTWPNKEVTVVCSKGLNWINDYVARIK